MARTFIKAYLSHKNIQKHEPYQGEPCPSRRKGYKLW